SSQGPHFLILAIAWNFNAKYPRHRDRLCGDHDCSKSAYHDCRADGVGGVVVARQEPCQRSRAHVSNNRSKAPETRAFLDRTKFERSDFQRLGLASEGPPAQG